jgi:hypothetical protein
MRFALLVGVLLLATACAPQREPARGGSRPGGPLPGWIEFVLEDRDIPADPLASAADGPQPPTCELEVFLNEKSVISLALSPSGESPPYSLSSRFRVRAHQGEYTAVVHYSSCRNSEHRPDSREASIQLVVAPGGLTRARFDGTVLTTRGPELLIESSRKNP